MSLPVATAGLSASPLAEAAGSAPGASDAPPCGRRGHRGSAVSGRRSGAGIGGNRFAADDGAVRTHDHGAHLARTDGIGAVGTVAAVAGRRGRRVAAGWPVDAGAARHDDAGNLLAAFRFRARGEVRDRAAVIGRNERRVAGTLGVGVAIDAIVDQLVLGVGAAGVGGGNLGRRGVGRDDLGAGFPLPPL